MKENAGLYIIVAALWLSAMIQLGRWALRVRLQVIDNKRRMNAEIRMRGEERAEKGTAKAVER